MKKNHFLILLLLLCTNSISVFAQDIHLPKLRIGYGTSIMIPAAGIGHNIMADFQIKPLKKGDLRAEVSYFHAGSYWTSFKSNQTPTTEIIYVNPSRVRLVNAGVKFNHVLYEKGNSQISFSWGALAGYGLIETEEREVRVTDTSIATSGIETTSYFAQSVQFWGVIPVQFSFTKFYEKVGFSLIPSYYQIGRYRGNLGLFLTMNF